MSSIRTKTTDLPTHGASDPIDLDEGALSHRYLAVALHVFAMCFMLLTSSEACWAVPAEAVLAELEPEVLPVICISWPTWSLSSAVLPDWVIVNVCPRTHGEGSGSQR